MPDILSTYGKPAEQYVAYCGAKVVITKQWLFQHCWCIVLGPGMTEWSDIVLIIGVYATTLIFVHVAVLNNFTSTISAECIHINIPNCMFSCWHTYLYVFTLTVFAIVLTVFTVTVLAACIHTDRHNCMSSHWQP